MAYSIGQTSMIISESSPLTFTLVFLLVVLVFGLFFGTILGFLACKLGQNM